ncbi:dTDP-4-dehydrorhamnose reductase [Beijerinckia indica]|uniref:dTDP-4-dehydrorhamnose reductase n=1 Tax=Beijerinckia indica subsp. indica (strain ATCC 9039 / DSM 1715 / NCIMB 8712) TaxID=395963 RepID=B2IFF8_BEII9|nr:dTDP-4-dehydrorhamnose reductase [Beijerinckia indica]ACB97058.1 dTDP-4-dehydrorhamnose reductase [Beijerinckia indica subsp. indica ATCC 9039]
MAKSPDAPILVFGAGGQLGQEVMAQGSARGLPVQGVKRAEADIGDAAAVTAAIESRKPRLILNAAAFTAVDKAESEPEAAHLANVVGIEILAKAAARFDVPLVHISTDYVFDGSKQGAYVESDPIKPLGVYGATKAEGEARLRAAAPKHIILRTAWVFGPYGANFLKTMLRLAGERDLLRVVADQRGCPTATADIAAAVFAIDQALDAPAADLWGTYHFAGADATTWHAFADAIVEAQTRWSGRRPKVEAITTQDYPTPAKRPQNSELNSGLFAATFGYRAAPLAERIAETLASLRTAA